MIPFTSITRNTNGSWTFAWSDQSAAYYRVVLDGIVLSKTLNPNYTYNTGKNLKFPPAIEIAYEDKLVLSEKYSPYLVVQWYNEIVLGKKANHYLVEKLVSAIWNRVATINESGLYVYAYRTPVLLDETTYSYRVIAVDDVGNLSIPRQYQKYIVCPPTSPESKIALNYTGPSTHSVQIVTA